MNDLKNNHYLHGAGIAGLLYLITKNAPVSLATGAGAGWYMTRYGHSFPFMTQSKPDHKVSLNNANSHTAAFNHTHIALERKDDFNGWLGFMGMTN